MKRSLLLLAVFATSAFADILPDDVAVCRGKSAGAACNTDTGQAGTCVESSVSRPDYSTGIPPKYKQVKMLTCVATAKGSARSALPWLGAGLAFLAAIAALALKPRRPTPTPA